MYIAGQKDMQAIDQYMIEQIGLPGAVLMENAGGRIADEIVAHTPKKSKILILAGGGNNGGDGFVIARRLFDLGIIPILYIVVDPRKIKGDALIHYKVYKNRNLPIKQVSTESIAELRVDLSNADVIVDAMLGTGVKGAVREPISMFIKLVNEHAKNKVILSVDIPSGVSSDDGSVEGVAIQATKTISFTLPKKGFFLQDGPKYIGEWKIVDISIPASIADDLNLYLPKLITPSLIQTLRPERQAFGHKGTFGHVLVVGGSRPYVGAPTFSAKAALYSGAGLATLAIPENIYPLVASQNSECLFLPLNQEEGHISLQAIEQISNQISQYDAIVLGPGMGRFSKGAEWLETFIKQLRGQPIVVDADALFFSRKQLELLKEYEGDVILTPHPGEMATLLGKKISYVEENRLQIGEQFAKEHALFLVLKGHRTIVSTPSGELYVNPYGHDALAKGGSGDVLAGLIASFLAQGWTAKTASITATYLHAKAGEERAEILSHYGVSPLDLIEGVRSQLMKWEKTVTSKV